LVTINIVRSTTNPKLALTLASLALILLGSAAADKKPYSSLKFTVVKSDSGKPVRNASVILHPVDKKGKQEKGGMQLKTDGEGRTGIEGIPYGKLRVQVITPGFQTFGEDFEIDQPTEDIVIKLERPKDQYSIYK
jgi:hypothetical protein